MNRYGVVIPVGPGRAENLVKVLECLNAQILLPEVVVLVCDGPEAHLGIKPQEGFNLKVEIIHAPKHEPGMEQPRNIGVRRLQELGCSHVWFLDTDVIVGEDCLKYIDAAYGDTWSEVEGANVVICPYDWLPPGIRIPQDSLRNDPRWGSFEEYHRGQVVRGDFAAGLACFSGNLSWNIEEFMRVGGFWNELYHGRCEDGELGLRAVAMDVPITFQRHARGWHLWHPVNEQLVRNRDARDVPMINDRHPWVQQEGLYVADGDGKCFKVKCPKCGQEFERADEFWRRHQRECK